MFISCSRYKDITYVKGLGASSSDTLIKESYSKYKVQPFDILFIRINSIDNDASAMFNQVQSSNSSLSINYYLYGNVIDEFGNTQIPVIGSVNVAGKTINEIQNEIQKKAEKYISDASVVVKLVSYKITVLGEVKSPGQKNIMADRANILEVLALSGDISYYGNKHNILIIRQVEGGSKTSRIDVTDKNLLSSNYYYVQPNDIIYVEPQKNTAFRLSVAEYSLLLSTLTTTLTTFFLIKSYINK